jgi:hypothetical protein
MAAASAPVKPLAGSERASHLAHMVGKDKEREERLAAALRENLRRRKTQAREQQQQPPPDDGE